MWATPLAARRGHGEEVWVVPSDLFLHLSAAGRRGQVDPVAHDVRRLGDQESAFDRKGGP